jgi:hypothetical protein
VKERDVVDDAVWEEAPVHRPSQAPQAAELVARAGLRGMSGPYQDADISAGARQVKPEYLPDRAGSDDQIIHVAIIHKNIWICEGDGGAALAWRRRAFAGAADVTAAPSYPGQP